MQNISNKNQEKTYGLYCRTSTNLQSKGLDSQQKALEAYCAQKGILNYIIYKDEGISGAKDSRPSLNKMMKDVEDGKIQAVCVYSFSRYARSTTHLLKALEIFKEKGVSFISLSENIDTDSSLGIAVFTIISAISQLERDLIRERVVNGLKAAKARGVKLGRKKTRNSALIRELYSKGFTYKSISQATNCSNGSIAAEIREYKKELEDKKQLDKALREREFRSVKDELEKTKAKIASLSQKIPEEEREKLEKSLLNQLYNSNNDVAA